MNLALSTALQDRLWKQWTQAPWHCWFKEQPLWLDLFLEAALQVPREEMIRLLQPVCPLIVLPPVDYGRVIRVNAPLLGGARILQLNGALLKRPKAEALALIAHELAHLTFLPTGDANRDDLEADRRAAHWGFAEGIKAALQRDLNESHPRWLALEKKI